MARILVADDEANVRFAIRETLRREGHEIAEAENGEEAVERATADEFDVIVLDIKMPKLDGLEAMRLIRERRPNAICLIVTAYGSPKIGRQAIGMGAYDYFNKPFDLTELRIVVSRAIERSQLERKLAELEQEREDAQNAPLPNIIGRSEAMSRLADVVRRIGDSDVTTLVTGESGTGKELVSQAIHDLSRRKAKHFVKINCAAIPENLLESELFGHEKGAFTGALQRKIGLLETGNGGTVLLDEIGEIPIALQPKLLRALQEREVQRVGGAEPIPVDFRLIAATNRDLLAEVDAGRFREDLYYRINVIPVKVPPLREREGDVPLLVNFFLKKYSREFGKEVRAVTPEAMSRLTSYAWPGNVRELENVIQSGVVMASDGLIQPEHLTASILGREPRPSHVRSAAARDATLPVVDDPNITPPPLDLGRPLKEIIEEKTAEWERQIIMVALERTGGKRQDAADLLGITRKSLYNKMEKYGISEKYSNR